LQDFTCEELAEAFQCSFQASGGGASRLVFLAVFQEEHRSGEMHYHVAIKLSSKKRWQAWKRNLLSMYGLSVHFSSRGEGYAGTMWRNNMQVFWMLYVSEA